MAKSCQSIELTLVVKIDAPVKKVFEAMTKNIASWWGEPYVVGEAKNLILEPKLGGRFYEVWSANSGSLWGFVTEIDKNKRLEISGSIGMSGVVHGKLGFDLEAKGKGTFLKMTHAVMGTVDEDLKEGYLIGWKDLLEIRLKAFCEKGKKYGIGHKPPVGAPNIDE